MAGGRITSVRRIRPKTLAPKRPTGASPTKARAKVQGQSGVTFPTINISSKRVKVSNLPVGAPVPNTIVFGRTTFTKKGK